MKQIKFKYRDEMSKFQWREQSCICGSVEECIKFYGLDELGQDNYEILEVKDI